LSLIFVVFLLVAKATAADAAVLEWSSILDAGQRCSGLPKEVIFSVIWVESKGNPNAININGVGSFSPGSQSDALRIARKYNRANVDVGLMQINYKTWGPYYGLTLSHLLDPMVNVCIGSRILRNYIDEHKGSWRGVGRYNAVSYNKQVNYAQNVARTLKAVKKLMMLSSWTIFLPQHSQTPQQVETDQSPSTGEPVVRFAETIPY